MKVNMENCDVIVGDDASVWLRKGALFGETRFLSGHVVSMDRYHIGFDTASLSPSCLSYESNAPLGVMWSEIRKIERHGPKTRPVAQVPAPDLKAWYYEQPSGRAWQLEVWCPACEEVHRHGGGGTESEPVGGNRVAHCNKESPFEDHGYNLVDLTPFPQWCEDAPEGYEGTHRFELRADGPFCLTCDRRRKQGKPVGR